MPIQPADLSWPDGLPYSAQFRDIYFSTDNGLAEAEYVFLQANQLAERFAALPNHAAFTIAETGFGTGLNFLAAWRLWQHTCSGDQWLHFVSVEKHPLTRGDLQQALALWPELTPWAQQLVQQYPPLTAGWHRLVFPESRLTLTLLLGDANELLPELAASVDAWFLDGFAPDKNPQLWQLELMQHVARLSKPGTTLASYTCAGEVRRRLASAGFTVCKAKGFGRKRQMITATLMQALQHPLSWLTQPEPVNVTAKQAIVIGAGIAGVSCARALSQRGWQVTIIDKGTQPATGASGNPAAIIYPKLAPPTLSAWHFQQQAYLWLLQQLQHDDNLADIWQQTGLLWLLAGNQLREGEKLKNHPWPEELVHQVSAEQASTLAGCTIDAACMYFPQAGFIKPLALCQHWLNHPAIHPLWQQEVTDLDYQDGVWTAYNAEGQALAQAPVVIIANALAAQKLAPSRQLPLTPVRGQISRFAATTESSPLQTVLCYGGYISPAIEQEHCLGASFLPNNSDIAVRDEDHQHNLQLLSELLPELAAGLPPIDTWQGRASLRAQTSDYLPMVGPLPRYEDFCQRYQGINQGKMLAEAPVYHPGLYVSAGHGSKGFCYAPLAAEIIAAGLNNEPYPVAKRVLHALMPARFWLRQLKRRVNRHDQETTSLG